MIIIKTLVLINLSLIAFQDIKDRLVWWFLFPLLAVFGGFLYLENAVLVVVLASMLINILLLSVILGVVYLYVRFYLRKEFLQQAFGLGDILFLGAFAISFPTISFVIFYLFSVLFSIVMNTLLSRNLVDKTIPLAGFMALFLIGVYLSYWFGFNGSIYRL